MKSVFCISTCPRGILDPVEFSHGVGADIAVIQRILMCCLALSLLSRAAVCVGYNVHVG